MTKYPNIISVCGEGRDVGKTLFVCSLIAKFHRTSSIIGLKITHHKHSISDTTGIVFKDENTILFEETDLYSSKDTGRMLAAGAHKSYLLQTNDDELAKAIAKFFELVGSETLVICESGKLAEQFETGINFYVRQLNCKVCDVSKHKRAEESDRIVNFDGRGFDIDLNSIQINKNKWNFTENE